MNLLAEALPHAPAPPPTGRAPRRPAGNRQSGTAGPAWARSAFPADGAVLALALGRVRPADRPRATRCRVSGGRIRREAG